MSTFYNKIFKSNDGHEFKLMIESYNSPMEVVNDCNNRKITDSSFHDMRKKGYDSFEGVESYEEALSFMKNGYQPTVEKLKETVKCNKVGTGKRISFKNNIVGGNPVVPLAIMGVPNSMVDMQMKPIKCKVIDVYYDMSVPFYVDSKDIIEAGQKLLGTIFELENQGYKFNLYAVQTYTDCDSGDVLAVKIKSSNQPIDLKKMSFPLTHTGFFRVIGFDWYSKCPKAKYRGAYGCNIASHFDDDDDELKRFGNECFGDNAMYISAKHIIEKDEEYIKEVLLNGSNNKRR